MAYYALLWALLFLFSQGSALTEENVEMTLYLEEARVDGANRNSIFSVGSGGFGSIQMRDRPIADGRGPNANIVGRAQAVYFYTKIDGAGAKRSMYLNLVFEDASRFNGSTLQVAGIAFDPVCEFGIVGGTGRLSMARGTVKGKVTNVPAPGRILELTVNAYYSPVPAIGVSSNTGMESPIGFLRAII